MRSRITIALALAGVALAAGCSSSGGGGKTASAALTTSTASSPSASPSADNSQALREWGSLVAGLEAPVTKAAGALANCTAGDYGTDAPRECTLGPLGLDFASQTFSISLETGEKTLGEPPAEIAALVIRTKSDAEDIHSTQTKVGDVCGQTMTDACTRALIPFYAAKERLLADFDAWRPYTH